MKESKSAAENMIFYDAVKMPKNHSCVNIEPNEVFASKFFFSLSLRSKNSSE